MCAVIGVSFGVGREWGIWEESFRVDAYIQYQCNVDKAVIEQESILSCAAIVGPLESRLRNAESSLSSCNIVRDATYETCANRYGLKALARMSRSKRNSGMGGVE